MEGPSLHILQEELSKFIKQKIVDCYGNAAFNKESIINQNILDIYAFGKRLIIQLDDCAIVIHFLMYGTYRIDEFRQGLIPRLAIIIKKHSLCFYNCSVKLLLIKNLKKKLPLDIDILSADWNINKVVKEIKRHPKETIDDVLLDQEIFAGVGNIIKNEALFLSKVLPYCKVSELTPKKIKEIAFNTRMFSEKFMELRKKFELKKNLSIYRKKFCPICNSKVIRKKTGKRNRWSFFCSSCQKKANIKI